MTKTNRAFLKALSAVTGNLSAAWFALILVAPTFNNILESKTILVLTQNIILGIVFLVLTAFIERKLAK